jgi:hypothetical protein
MLPFYFLINNVSDPQAPGVILVSKKKSSFRIMVLKKLGALLERKERRI